MSTMRFRRPEHSEIKHKNMRFLITDRPTDSNIEKYFEVNRAFSFKALFAKFI
jgi:hypothetical protein